MASMPSEEELLSYWEPDQLKRWPETLLRARGFSLEDTKYLSKIGLPRTNDWSWEIGDQVDDLPLVGSLVTVALDTMVVPIAADVANEGCLFAVEEPGSHRFMNSSVRHFGGCLYHFRRIAYFDQSRDPKRCFDVCRDLFAKIVDLDPAAVEHEETYWTLILAQIKAGTF